MVYFGKMAETDRRIENKDAGRSDATSGELPKHYRHPDTKRTEERPDRTLSGRSSKRVQRLVYEDESEG